MHLSQVIKIPLYLHKNKTVDLESVNLARLTEKSVVYKSRIRTLSISNFLLPVYASASYCILHLRGQTIEGFKPRNVHLSQLIKIPLYLHKNKTVDLESVNLARLIEKSVVYKSRIRTLPISNFQCKLDTIGPLKFTTIQSSAKKLLITRLFIGHHTVV